MSAPAAAAAAGGGAVGEAGEGEKAPKKQVTERKLVKVQGAPKSARGWKHTQKMKSSLASRGTATAASKRQRSAFHVRAALKRSMQAAKEYAEAEKARIQEERDAARARREERKRRREENEYKNASYQVLKDPEKIKRMNKKQLRAVKRTRMTERGTVEFVSPYAKGK